MSKIFIGVAWPYANGAIHLGHIAGSLLPPDIFSRYHHLKGDRVLMVSGSDMHGTPVTVTADREGVTPLEVAERSHIINTKAIEDMGIEFDLFTKTHTDNHVAVVHDVFNRLLDQGLLYCKESLQYFCSRCDRFLPDRYVEGICPACGFDRARGDQCDQCGKTFDVGELIEGRCTVCEAAPELRSTEHFYIRLSAFQERLLEFVDQHPWWRANVQTFTRNWLQDGLEDRPITRDMTYGVPVPVEGWEAKVIYVWFEAVIGYLSASKQLSTDVGDPDMWREFWNDPECRHYYFLGKDNIPFHSILGPAILRGYGDLQMPYDIPANEFLTFKGRQFSKSRGVSISIPDLVSRFDSDVIRYYTSVIMPENRDADFSWEDFQAKVNNELVAALGNYYHRVLSFTHKNFGAIPPFLDDEAERQDVLNAIAEATAQVDEHLSRCEFKRALQAFMELARFGNRYFDQVKPWALIKGDRERCGSVLNLNLEIVGALAVLSNPFLPRSSEELWSMMGHRDALRSNGWEALERRVPVGQRLQPPTPLFERIDLKEPDSMDDTFKGFEALDLRVGEIVEVGDHPDADKLYVMTVDIGEERTIVAGLKAFYTKDELQGRKVVCVSNLKPAKLRGIKSQGMLLAADEGGDENVQLLRPAVETANGDRVWSSLSPSGKRVSYSEFENVALRIGSPTENGVRLDEECGLETGPVTELPECVAVYLPEEGGKALLLFTEGGVPITVDRPMRDGAQVR